MYCRNCGHLLKEGDKFCPNCGARMDTQMGSSFENDFIPPFKRGLESQNEENNGHDCFDDSKKRWGQLR